MLDADAENLNQLDEILIVDNTHCEDEPVSQMARLGDDDQDCLQ